MNMTLKKVGLLSLSLILVVVLILLSFNFSIDQGKAKLTVTVGDPVNAAGISPDVNGTTSTAVQTALDMVANTGGEVYFVSSSYTFTGTVSRAIDNVVFKLNGATITNDGVTPLFDIGSQKGWSFYDGKLDAGGITLSSGESWTLNNVWFGTTYYSLRTDQTIYAGNASAPTGRTATYVIAASDSTALEKAQADYVCLGYSTLTATLTGATLTSPSSISSGSTEATEVTVSGNGTIVVTLPTGMTAIATSGTSTVTGSPQSLVAGANNVVCTGAGTIYISGMGDEYYINLCSYAIAAVSPSMGQISFTSGNYNIFRPITYYNNISYIGQGWVQTAFKLVDHANCHMWQHNNTSTLSQWNIWSGMEMDGNGANQSTSATSSGISDLYQMLDSSIEKCFIYSFKTYNILITNSWNISITKNVFEKSYNICLYVVAGRDCRISDNKFLYNAYDINIKATDCQVINNFFYHDDANPNPAHGYNITIAGTGSRNKIVSNSFKEYTTSGTVYCIVLTDQAGANVINDNTFYGGGTINGAVSDTVSSSVTGTNNQISNNTMYGFVLSRPIYVTSTVDKPLVFNNLGSIAPGEVRTYSGTIGTLTENAFNSLDNPFGQAVRVLSLDFYISTAAGDTTPNSTIDSGIGSSATTDYTTLFEGVDCEVVGFYNSVNSATIGKQTVPQLWASGSGNRYLNMSIKDAAATGMVCKYTVTVMGN